MTDIPNTALDAAAAGQTVAPSGTLSWVGPLVGPIWLAREGAWGLFWLFVLLDAWAVGSLVQGDPTLAAALAALGRAALVARRAGLLGRAVKPAGAAGQPASAWLLAGGAYLATLALIVLRHLEGEAASLLATFPSVKVLHNVVAANIDALIRYMTVAFDPTFRVVTATLLGLLSLLESALEQVPWPVFFLLLGLLAWRRGGWRLLLLIWTAFGYLGLFGYWDKAITTSALVLSALVVCLLLGVPIGVAAAKSRWVRVVVEPVLDFMQTMPSFVYLLPAVAFFSIGKPPALIATVVFAIPPLIRLTSLGIQQVPAYVKEAMYAHGATPLQTLLKAELPLALPSIRAGMNQSIMMSLSMVVIAALIGGGGLGYDVLFALQNVQHGKGILAGIAIVFCAMMFDRLVRSAARDDKAR